MKPGFKFLATLILTVPFLVSCLAPGRDLISSSDELGAGQVVIVGKVSLTPPLKSKEQDLNMIGSEGRRNRLFLLMGDQWRQLQVPLGGDDYKGRIEAPLERTFFAASDAAPFYILGGALTMSLVNSAESNDVYFPGGFKVDVRPNDRAVYIGTIHYYRNEFFQITKMVVEDDYEAAAGIYAKHFRGTLRKALLIPVK